MEASKISENSAAAYKVKGSGFINFVNISFVEQVRTRYITLFMPRNERIISMCEVEIYGTDCMYGFYGVECKQPCGQCYNSEPCDDITGECMDCQAGYMGPKCENECKPGTYGYNCLEECGVCRQYSSCDHVTGICVHGCAAGRRGSFCKQDCESNTYGESCSQKCHCQSGVSCNSFNGSCENGAYADGYSGTGCQQTSIEKQQTENGIALPIFIGVIAVLICVIIVLIVIVIVRISKCRNNQAEGFGDPSDNSKKTESRTYDDLQL